MRWSKILTWEITGIITISSLGSLLHFVFEMLGNWPPAALIASVNESVWEHLKLAFWPALLFGLIEWPFFRRHVKHFWAAKAFGIFAIPVIITLGFYGYTTLAGGHILWADIALFVIAVAAGQMISAGLLRRESIPRAAKTTAGFLLVLMIVSFSLCTYFPPRFPLFRDARTGHYGIMGS
jgi:hypothetical protein